MRILTIASQKGGTGKTTWAAHLSVEAERRRAGPVAVIDTDPQGSLAAWKYVSTQLRKYAKGDANG